MSGLSIEQIIWGEDFKYEEEEDKFEDKFEDKPFTVESTKNITGEKMQKKFDEINKIRLCKQITDNEEYIDKSTQLKKYNTGFGEKTGEILRFALIPNLCIIDIDFNKDIPENVKIDLKKKFEATFKENNFQFVVETAHGGYHIYCRVNDYNIYNFEKCVKVVRTEHYDIDLFAYNWTLEKHTKNMHVLKWGSKVQDTEDDPILEYKIIIGKPLNPLNDSLDKIITVLNHKSEFDEKLKREYEKKLNPPSNKKSEAGLKTASSENVRRNKFKKRNVRLTQDLLNVILAGFSVKHFGKSEVIHAHSINDNIKERPANINLISAIKSIELLNDDLEPVEQFNINNILNRFSSCEVLTSKARGLLITDYNRFSVGEKNECFVDWMMLVWILKYHAKDYYTKHFKKVFMGNNAKFLNSTTTWNKFLTNKQFDTITDLISKISECVAAIGGNEEFIVRKIKKRKLTLVKHSRTEFISLASVSVKVKTTKEEREEMKAKKKKVKEYKCFSLDTLVKITEYLDKLPNFEECEIYTSDKKVLSLYQPPRPTNYNSQLINNWLRFVKSLIEPDYVPALNELFSSISYKLRNPDRFIRKFFVQYGKGNDGKSYLISCLATIFAPFCNHGIKFSQMTKDQFNSWTVKLLLLWMEEVQGNRDNVDVLQLSELVKQVTTPQVSTRAMHHECELSNNIGIIGLNTNQKDLKGLTRADSATKSRLVIIKYQGYKHGDDLEFEEKCTEFIEHPDFAWSLYYYFMNEYEIPKDFKTNRYNGKEKEEFINEAEKDFKSVAAAFISDIKFIYVAKNSDKSDDIKDVLDENEQNNLCIKYEDANNKQGEPVFKFLSADFTNTYAMWKQLNTDYKPVRSITEELCNKLNFVKCRVKNDRCLVILKTEFESLLNRYRDNILGIDV